MRVVSLSQPAATLTITRQPCDCYVCAGDPYTPHAPSCASLSMVSRWVTFDYACPSEVVGTRIAIAATKRKPKRGRVGNFYVEAWFDEVNHVNECDCDSEEVGVACQRRSSWRPVMSSYGHDEHDPLPLGVVVGSAIVEASYPIVGPEDTVTPAGSACIVVDSHFLTLWDAPDYWGEANEHDISDQLPYCDWSPGRFAWHLTDAEALPEPVSWVSSGGRLPEWQTT